MTPVRRIGSVVALLALAGCGSTVRDVGLTARSNSSELSGSPVAGDATVTSGLPGPAHADGGSLPPSDAATSGLVDAASGAPAARASAAQNKPVNAPVTLGLMYLKNINTAAAAQNVPGLSTGDSVGQTKAIVAWVNAHGGFGGRHVTLVTYGIDANSTNPLEVDGETACESFAQDHHASYVMAYIALQGGAPGCFAQHKIVILDDAAAMDAATAQTVRPYFYAPGDFLADRLNVTLIHSLISTGWLTHASVVALYYWDEPGFHRIADHVIVPELAANGIKVAMQAAISQDDSGLSSNPAYVVKFRKAGVDRIFPINTSPLFLMQAAESQHYYPRYAVNSIEAPGALLETAAPTDQLNGAQGIGYQPYSDIGKGVRPGPVSSNETRCLAIMNAAGLGTTSPTTRAFQLQLCDMTFFLHNAFMHAESVDAASLMTLARARPFLSAATFASDLSSGRPDGAAAYRVLNYETPCKCFQYTSPLTRLH